MFKILQVNGKNEFKGRLTLHTKHIAMKKEELAQLMIERLTQWEVSQKNQTSGYQYEKSYLELMKEIEAEIFRQMVETNQGESKKK